MAFIVPKTLFTKHLRKNLMPKHTHLIQEDINRQYLIDPISNTSYDIAVRKCQRSPSEALMEYRETKKKRQPSSKTIYYTNV